MIRSSMIVLFAVAGSTVALGQTTLDFDTPGIAVGPSQAPGVWYTDRYAPADFESGYMFGGNGRLRQGIHADDGTSARPSSFSSTFYDTQGRKYDNDSGTTSMSIDLYVPGDWATTGRRMAGFWGTAVDGADAISGFPIIEFTSNDDDDGSGARFRYYTQDVDQDPGNGLAPGWLSMGLPTGFNYDSWHTLEIELDGSDWLASVNGQQLIVDNATVGSVGIDNVILQGHNTDAGVTYDILWDNYAAVPAPGSLALLGLAGLTAARRRRV
ncbi:MAG: PEP-CTERM sorting domain-containing protein [Phycisphaerales bacterium JB060]